MISDMRCRKTVESFEIQSRTITRLQPVMKLFGFFQVGIRLPEKSAAKAFLVLILLVNFRCCRLDTDMYGILGRISNTFMRRQEGDACFRYDHAIRLLRLQRIGAEDVIL